MTAGKKKVLKKLVFTWKKGIVNGKVKRTSRNIWVVVFLVLI